jgi:hypothetical protein
MRDRVVDNVMYVFVCLNDPPAAPQYFICTPEEARSKVAQYSTRGIIDLTRLRKPEYAERWDKIEVALSGPESLSVASPEVCSDTDAT